MSNASPNVIIGIAGPSCSGKSTLEANLQLELGEELTTFPFDDLFVGPDAVSDASADIEGPESYRWDDYFDHLSSLARGVSVSLISHSQESQAAKINKRVLAPRPVIVVAGFLALHSPRINGFFDTTVFIDLDDDEIVRRRMARALPNDPYDTEDYIKGPVLNGNRRYVLPQRDIAEHILDGASEPSALTAEAIEIIRHTQFRKTAAQDSA